LKMKRELRGRVKESPKNSVEGNYESKAKGGHKHLVRYGVRGPRTY